jgi:hypothetical protein
MDQKMKALIKKFADFFLMDPAFKDIPDDIMGAVSDPALAPILASTAHVFLLGKEDNGTDEELEKEGDALFHAFYLESLRRMFASDRPKTFAFRDRKVRDFMKVLEFAFDEDEAIHSMRLKIQGLIGIELSVEKMREIMQETIADAIRPHEGR